MLGCRASAPQQGATKGSTRWQRSKAQLPVWRHAVRAVQCQASKTTSSRSKTTSSRSAEGVTPTQQQQLGSSDVSRKPAANSSKSLQERLGDVGERIGSYFHFLVPKQEGDIGDVLMMSISMAVLIYFSMQLYRLYAYAYFHASSYSMVMDMMSQ